MIEVYVDGAGGLFKNGKTGKLEIRGKSMIGIFIPDKNIKKKFIIEPSTNNEAEFRALIYGLLILTSMKIKEAVIYSDSKLVVESLNGNYTIRADNLKELFDTAKRLLYSKNKKYTIKWIPKKMQKAHPS